MSRERIIILLATGAGLGYAPVASGTFGTLGGLVLLPFVAAAGQVPAAFLTGVLILLAVWVAGEAEALFAEKDSGWIVIDEIVGYLVAMLFLPLTAVTLAMSFFLFRLFDVLKPWPARHFDRNVSGGVGVVMDDVFAGAYTNLILQFLFFIGWLPI